MSPFANPELLAAPEIMSGARDTVSWFRSVPPTSWAPLDNDSIAVVCRGLSGNVTALRTAEGLLLCDTGAVDTAQRVFDAVRAWDPTAPVHTILYTHGHFDHAHGTHLYDREAKNLSRAQPRVVAHANVIRRFERYRKTAELNRTINVRQYSRPGFAWPTDHRAPDKTFHERLVLTLGGEEFELNHGRGETDDHAWLWSPARRLVVSGDFVMWAAPNAGNPQKVQRYAGDWAEALRQMMARSPAILVPGHGPPIVGADLIHQYLDAAARWLESLHEQTLALLNQGRRVDEIAMEVRVPAELAAKPWLQPTYDDPEFVVRGICRLYGGWWDGNPAHLKPARPADLAAELASLAGGPRRLAERAAELSRNGEDRLAGHLAELAALAAPEEPFVQRVRAQVNEARAEREPSQMAKGIYRAAARESAERASGSPLTRP